MRTHSTPPSPKLGHARLVFLLLYLIGSGLVTWWLYRRTVSQVEEIPPASSVEFVRADIPSPSTERIITEHTLGVGQGVSEEVLALNEAGLVASRAGDHALAIAKFRRALRLAPEQEVLKANLANALLEAAIEDYPAGELERGIERLLEATELVQDQVTLFDWLAFLQEHAGQNQEALETILRAEDFGLESANLYRMRADQAAARGEVDEAVKWIDRAVALAPERERLQERAQHLRHEAEVFRTYLTDHTAHFDSRYDPLDSSVVAVRQELARDLEEAWQDAVSLTGLQRQERLLVIWLNVEQYRWQAPAWSAGLYDGRIRILVDDYEQEADSIRRTLRHELTHALIEEVGRPVPTWLHEGLAQMADGSPSHLAKERLRKAEAWPHMRELTGDWTLWTDSTRARLAYDYSLAFAAWLQEEFSATCLSHLLEGIDRGGFDEAWSQVFGRDLDSIELDFRRQLR